jgi:hypothetical protein
VRNPAPQLSRIAGSPSSPSFPKYAARSLYRIPFHTRRPSRRRGGAAAAACSPSPALRTRGTSVSLPDAAFLAVAPAGFLRPVQRLSLWRACSGLSVPPRWLVHGDVVLFRRRRLLVVASGGICHHALQSSAVYGLPVELC